ncbi:MAG: SRPBCC domain-containing protein [Solirubrobacterales bacterium]|nr:SRPBCC domain-containing protein [Solirubrobacterales bacterium]
MTNQAHQPAAARHSTEATLLATGARPVLRFERHLPQPLESVWRVLTDPVEMRSWFPTRIEIDEWKQGALLTHHFDEHDIAPIPGKVIEWDPPRRARFTWGTDTIGFELTDAPGGGTIFVLTEELGASIAARNAAGWETCLDRLEASTERNQNRESEPPRPDWQARFDHYVRVFEPILGPQQGPPAGARV